MQRDKDSSSKMLGLESRTGGQIVRINSADEWGELVHCSLSFLRITQDCPHSHITYVAQNSSSKLAPSK